MKLKAEHYEAMYKQRIMLMYYGQPDPDQVQPVHALCTDAMAKILGRVASGAVLLGDKVDYFGDADAMRYDMVTTSGSSVEDLADDEEALWTEAIALGKHAIDQRDKDQDQEDMLADADGSSDEDIMTVMEAVLDVMSVVVAARTTPLMRQIAVQMGGMLYQLSCELEKGGGKDD